MYTADSKIYGSIQHMVT